MPVPPLLGAKTASTSNNKNSNASTPARTFYARRPTLEAFARHGAVSSLNTRSTKTTTSATKRRVATSAAPTASISSTTPASTTPRIRRRGSLPACTPLVSRTASAAATKRSKAATTSTATTAVMEGERFCRTPPSIATPMLAPSSSANGSTLIAVDSPAAESVRAIPIPNFDRITEQRTAVERKPTTSGGDVADDDDATQQHKSHQHDAASPTREGSPEAEMHSIRVVNPVQPSATSTTTAVEALMNTPSRERAASSSPTVMRRAWAVPKFSADSLGLMFAAMDINGDGLVSAADLMDFVSLHQRHIMCVEEAELLAFLSYVAPATPNNAWAAMCSASSSSSPVAEDSITNFVNAILHAAGSVSSTTTFMTGVKYFARTAAPLHASQVLPPSTRASSIDFHVVAYIPNFLTVARWVRFVDGWSGLVASAEMIAENPSPNLPADARIHQRALYTLRVLRLISFAHALVVALAQLAAKPPLLHRSPRAGGLSPRLACLTPRIRTPRGLRRHARSALTTPRRTLPSSQALMPTTAASMGDLSLTLANAEASAAAAATSTTLKGSSMSATELLAAVLPEFALRMRLKVASVRDLSAEDEVKGVEMMLGSCGLRWWLRHLAGALRHLMAEERAGEDGAGARLASILCLVFHRRSERPLMECQAHCLQRLQRLLRPASGHDAAWAERLLYQLPYPTLLTAAHNSKTECSTSISSLALWMIALRVLVLVTVCVSVWGGAALCGVCAWLWDGISTPSRVDRAMGALMHLILSAMIPSLTIVGGAIMMEVGLRSLVAVAVAAQLPPVERSTTATAGEAFEQYMSSGLDKINGLPTSARSCVVRWSRAVLWVAFAEDIPRPLQAASSSHGMRLAWRSIVQHLTPARRQDGALLAVQVAAVSCTWPVWWWRWIVVVLLSIIHTHQCLPNLITATQWRLRQLQQAEHLASALLRVCGGPVLSTTPPPDAGGDEERLYALPMRVVLELTKLRAVLELLAPAATSSRSRDVLSPGEVLWEAVLCRCCLPSLTLSSEEAGDATNNGGRSRAAVEALLGTATALLPKTEASVRALWAQRRTRTKTDLCGASTHTASDATMAMQQSVWLMETSFPWLRCNEEGYVHPTCDAHVPWTDLSPFQCEGPPTAEEVSFAPCPFLTLKDRRLLAVWGILFAALLLPPPPPSRGSDDALPLMMPLVVACAHLYAGAISYPLRLERCVERVEGHLRRYRARLSAEHSCGVGPALSVAHLLQDLQ